MGAEVPSLRYVRAKLDRARTRAEELRLSLEAFDNSAPFTVQYGRHPLTGAETCTVRVRRAFEDEWQLLASEIVHHARSALDQTVTQLVIANGGSSLKHKGRFPIAMTGNDYSAERGRRPSYRAESLAGVDERAALAVDAMQPFHVAEPASHPLARLNALANGEKHRVGQPTLAVLRGTAVVHVDNESRTIHVLANDSPRDTAGHQHLRDGDDLWDFVTPEEVREIQRELTKAGLVPDRRKLNLIPRLGVAFDTGDGRAIVYTELVELLEFVEVKVLDRLESFLGVQPS